MPRPLFVNNSFVGKALTYTGWIFSVLQPSSVSDGPVMTNTASASCVQNIYQMCKCDAFKRLSHKLQRFSFAVALPWLNFSIWFVLQKHNALPQEKQEIQNNSYRSLIKFFFSAVTNCRSLMFLIGNIYISLPFYFITVASLHSSHKPFQPLWSM